MNGKTNLLLILVLATLIRLFFVFNLPITIDEQIMSGLMRQVSWQNIPVHYLSYSGENITITFLALPLVKSLKISEVLSLRLVALFFNLLFIIISYFLARKIFSSRVAFLSAFFLAVWPWSIRAGSIGYNAHLLPFFYILALYFLYWAVERKIFLPYILAVFCLAITFYSYAASFVWVPLMLITFCWVYRKEISLKFYLASIFFLVILTAPIFLFYFKYKFGIGPNSFLFFNLPNLPITRFDSISIFALYDGWLILFNYLYNYLLHLVLLFLAYNPDKGHLFFYLTYVWDVIFILVGLVFCWKNLKSDKAYRLLFCWFLVYPLVSSFVNAKAGFSFVRDIHALWLFAVLAAIGLDQILDAAKQVSKLSPPRDVMP